MNDHADRQRTATALPVSVAGTPRLPLRLTLRRGLALLLGAGAVVIAVMVAGPGGTPGLPYDPNSTGYDGLAGLVELLESFEVTVAIAHDPPRDQTTTVFIPADQLGTQRRAQLRAFAHGGGTLVVGGADALTHGLPAASAPASDLFGQTSRAPECDALSEVTRVASTNWQGMALPPGAAGCFPIDDDVAWLVATAYGRGTIIALGSADAFTNGMLDQEDNAVLAMRLLAPAPDAAVMIVPRPAVGEGDTPLLQLVPTEVWWGLWLLLAAVIMLTLRMARRLGSPVTERLPPVLPSAELARSVGRLLLRAGDRQAAAVRLRVDLRRSLQQQFGLPPAVSDQTLAERVIVQTGAEPTDVRVALSDGEVANDIALTELAAAIARVRRASFHPPQAARAQSDDVAGATP